MFNSSTYISTLPLTTQDALRTELTDLGLSVEDIDNALSSRISDLADTLPVTVHSLTN